MNSTCTDPLPRGGSFIRQNFGRTGWRDQPGRRRSSPEREWSPLAETFECTKARSFRGFQLPAEDFLHLAQMFGGEAEALGFVVPEDTDQGSRSRPAAEFWEGREQNAAVLDFAEGVLEFQKPSK